MSGSSEVWAQLLSSALVGLQRRPCTVSGVGGALDVVVPAGPVDEGGLLHAAAVLTVARRAGATARLMEVPDGVVLPDEAVVGAAASARLSALLGAVRAAGDQRGARRLLHEWLEIARDRGLVAPAHLVPVLLDLGAQDGTLRELIQAAGGARADWLAGLRPQEWGWSAHEPDLTEDDWNEGTHRVAYLEQLRRRDAAAGRDLLLSTWPSESATDLAKLIRACWAGLGPDDEEWLEKALDDRRAQVRSAAVPLLQRLPGSAYAARMGARVQAMCRASGKSALTVELPAEYDAGMKHDGIEQKPKYGQGPKVWWLEQIIESAPLDCWRAIDDDVARLLRRRVNDDLRQVVHRALTQAALNQRDAEWALHLAQQSTVVPHAARSLVLLLPPEQAAEVTVAALRAKASHSAAFLSAVPTPWPAPVVAAVLARLADRKLTDDSSWRGLVTHAESGLPPEVAADVEKPAGEVPFGEVLRQLAAFLHIRSEIHREFAR
jgi:Family of unknown function (DUF5691)